MSALQNNKIMEASEVVLFAILGLSIVENLFEIYISLRQVSHILRHHDIAFHIFQLLVETMDKARNYMYLCFDLQIVRLMKQLHLHIMKGHLSGKPVF